MLKLAHTARILQLVECSKVHKLLKVFHRVGKRDEFVPELRRRTTGFTLIGVNGGAKRDHRGGVKRDHLAAAGLSP
jgi:hypothetical protein